MRELCMLLGDWDGTLPEGAMVEQKIDGFRGLRFQGVDGITRLWSRNGIPIEGTGHIAYLLDLMERVAGEPMFFDGEFQVGGTLADTKAWFERGWKTGGEAGILHLFDGFTLREWKAGICETPLAERKARVSALLAEALADPIAAWEFRPGCGGDDTWRRSVQMIPDQWAFEASDVVDMARRVWAEGGEGVVVKDPMAPYVRARTAYALKVKGANYHKWARRAAA